MTPHLRHIYAVYDNVAQAVIGGLQLHYHDAPAIRMYSDIAHMPESTIGMHPQDYDLLDLGTLTDDPEIYSARRTVLTGAAWLASQTPRPNGEPDNAST